MLSDRAQIMEQDTKIAQLEEEISRAPVRKATDTVDVIPRAPHKFSLARHRSPITKVAFHPVFSILASASEDSTIIIWDYDSGEFERTLKGHTKAVQDITWDPKGNLLGMFPNRLVILESGQVLIIRSTAGLQCLVLRILPLNYGIPNLITNV